MAEKPTISVSEVEGPTTPRRNTWRFAWIISINCVIKHIYIFTDFLCTFLFNTIDVNYQQLVASLIPVKRLKKRLKDPTFRVRKKNRSQFFFCITLTNVDTVS